MFVVFLSFANYHYIFFKIANTPSSGGIQPTVQSNSPDQDVSLINATGGEPDQSMCISTL